MVSVIIPVYNGEKTIARALESAQKQRGMGEILVIDDGSVDGTAAVVSAFAAAGPVRYLKNEQNMGVAMSRNRGVQEAAFPYVAFLDADDCWLEGKLEEQEALLEKTGGMISSTARELMTPEGQSLGRVIPVKEQVTYQDLLTHNSIACSSVMMRRSAALEFPMEHAEVHEDYLTWLRVLKKYGVCYGINKPYLRYTVSSTGKSGHKLHSAALTFGVYRKAGLSFPRSCSCFVKYALNGVRKYYGPGGGR